MTSGPEQAVARGARAFSGPALVTGIVDPHAPAGGPGGTIRLLDADPSLCRYVDPVEAERARAAVIVPLVELPCGDFNPLEAMSAGIRPFAALIVDGVVARELAIGTQPSLRLLGEGDLVRRELFVGALVAPGQRWCVLMPARLAVLDDHFLLAVRRWPRLLPALIERLARAEDMSQLYLTIAQLPGVEERILWLFRALAERWGRMTVGGMVVALPLTHEAVGRLIGARRPTVTLAFKALSLRGEITREKDGDWTLPNI